jgi:hypothetical protein
LTGRAQRRVRRPGPTDGPPPGTHTAPGRAPATPAEGPGAADDLLMTIDEAIAELRVPRAAFYRRRKRGAGPAVMRLPGGGIRVWALHEPARTALSAQRWTIWPSGHLGIWPPGHRGEQALAPQASRRTQAPLRTPILRPGATGTGVSPGGEGVISTRPSRCSVSAGRPAAASAPSRACEPARSA